MSSYVCIACIVILYSTIWRFESVAHLLIAYTNSFQCTIKTKSFWFSVLSLYPYIWHSEYNGKLIFLHTWGCMQDWIRLAVLGSGLAFLCFKFAQLTTGTHVHSLHDGFCTARIYAYGHIIRIFDSMYVEYPIPNGLHSNTVFEYE